MPTDEQIEAACEWFNDHFNGQPDAESLVSGILTAAEQVRAPSTKEHRWEPIMDGTLCCQHCMVDFGSETSPVCKEAPALTSASAAGEAHRRWDIEEDGRDLLICRGEHDKSEKCTYVRYSPVQPGYER